MEYASFADLITIDLVSLDIHSVIRNLIVLFLLARAIIRKNYAEKLKIRFHKIKKVGYMAKVHVRHNILPFWLIIFGVQVDVHCRVKFRILVKIEVLATVL